MSRLSREDMFQRVSTPKCTYRWRLGAIVTGVVGVVVDFFLLIDLVKDLGLQETMYADRRQETERNSSSLIRIT